MKYVKNLRIINVILKQFHCTHVKVNRNVNLTLKEVHHPSGLSIARTLFECDSRNLCGFTHKFLEIKPEECPACMYERTHGSF